MARKRAKTRETSSLLAPHQSHLRKDQLVDFLGNARNHNDSMTMTKNYRRSISDSLTFKVKVEGRRSLIPVFPFVDE